MVKFTRKELYGGAITVKIPSNLLDASEFRQVPDTQEVFLNSTENTHNYEELNKDDSIIFDLMEKLEVEDVEALKEHFGEISALNDAENNWELIKIEEIDNSYSQLNSGEIKTFIGAGIEPALKWGRSEGGKGDFKSTLIVVLGLIRLNKVETDALVTFNVLIEDQEELEHLQKLHQNGFVLDGNNANDNLALKRIDLAILVVKNIVSSFKVEDWNLFG